MIPNNLTDIYDYICNLVGTYTPYVNAQTGDFAIDWSYIVAGASFLIVLYWSCKSVFALLKSLLGGVGNNV